MAEQTTETPTVRFTKPFVAFKKNWKGLLSVLWPLMMAPILIYSYRASSRFFYILMVMWGYWFLEILPIQVTSFIPLVMAPLLGIVDSSKVSSEYLTEENMQCVGGMMISGAFQHTNLALRVARYILSIFGYHPRRIHIFITSIVVFASLFINENLFCVLLCPVVASILEEFNEKQLGNMNWTLKTKDEVHTPKIVSCYFLSIAYAATLGGYGKIVGNITNTKFVKFFKRRFPDITPTDNLKYLYWIRFTLPHIILTTIGFIFWMQCLFLGLLRKSSTDAQAVLFRPEQTDLTKANAKEKLKELGNFSLSEKFMFSALVLLFVLCLSREPETLPGWHHGVQESAVLILIVCILCILPSNLQFLELRHSNIDLWPTRPSPGVLTWRIIHEKVLWSAMIIIGCGFAIDYIGDKSELYREAQEIIIDMSRGMSPFLVLIVTSIFVLTFTEFFLNFSVIHLFAPALASVSEKKRINPIYTMMPVAYCASYSFCFPIATVANAVVNAFTHMPIHHMFVAGFVMKLWTYFVFIVLWTTLGTTMFDYDIDTFPAWAVNSTVNLEDYSFFDV